MATTMPPARKPLQRKSDVLELLRSETTAWLATGDTDGPHLVPLLFHHNGEVLTFATFAHSRTVTNVAATARARAAIGRHYDVVMIDGSMEIIEPGAIDPAIADPFASLLRGGPDPRHTPGFVYLQLTPTRLQAWRSFAELRGRTLMRSGQWLV
ncbi:pyridoxamine 5'-phosphate oxidase family protein [Amycolatopsis roodepoortensis]|uniref:pyridoxamine 5'-phosphate oxidase family protein n=1 Tax=Amycolatopsis roodepoortensis TaxID=700274 RepID=UPI00214ACA14|nr:pyridoxamine 5'-phosphate oxidase family protein [Amycolatopsis roodepoortensis]UUV32380.1 pyridoxamine 5'-phosphate oxidase family protein [Amycolatopsis roodepoortensis]